MIDPDPVAREVKTAALRRAGRRVTAFATEGAFLDVAGAVTAGWVFARIDDRAAAPFGLAKVLKARRQDLPVILEATMGRDVALAIEAMKSGAVDVLQAAADADSLLASVSRPAGRPRFPGGGARRRDRPRADSPHVATRARGP